MTAQVIQLLVDWKGLKKMGWPYSRQHTWRMMDDERDPFPRSFKLGKHRNSHPVWYLRDVRAYLLAHGMPADAGVLAP